jgi:hypothetical protein
MTTCPACGCELDDEGNCPECQERREDVLTTVLGEEPYQEPDDLEACYQNREMRTL